MSKKGCLSKQKGKLWIGQSKEYTCIFIDNFNLFIINKGDSLFYSHSLLRKVKRNDPNYLSKKAKKHGT